MYGRAAQYAEEGRLRDSARSASLNPQQERRGRTAETQSKGAQMKKGMMSR